MVKLSSITTNKSYKLQSHIILNEIELTNKTKNTISNTKIQLCFSTYMYKKLYKK